MVLGLFSIIIVTATIVGLIHQRRAGLGKKEEKKSTPADYTPTEATTGLDIEAGRSETVANSTSESRVTDHQDPPADAQGTSSPEVNTKTSAGKP